MQPDRLLAPVREIAIEAGRVIMEVYGQSFDVREKTDGSPVTTADNRAHALISSRLEALTPDIPVLSEESSDTAFKARRGWHRFWLVDPLDGTKEFIRRNGEFTVNIALIEGASPILGMVYTPAKDIIHQAAAGAGARRISGEGERSIRTRPFDRGEVCLVASRSHAGQAVDSYRNSLEQHVDSVRTTSMGSALKICLVAEGAADVYPRLGPTSEWDTAASHCVLNEAGGRLMDVNGRDLAYNKESLLNPWFLAVGDASHDWLSYVPRDDTD